MYSPDVVRQAFALRAAGKTQMAIADELGIGRGTLSRWLRWLFSIARRDSVALLDRFVGPKS